MTIEGDSREYDLLSSWAERTAKEFSKNKEEIMLTAEIGVRKGLATKLIMNYTDQITQDYIFILE